MTRLGDLTWPEAEQLGAAGAILAVPVGSTEQHGPHLPLATDTDIAVALADRLAAGRGDVVVAPPVGYGSSGEHAGFAGTISIGQEALELMLVELGRSAAETFAYLVLVSAHGGNAAPVIRAAGRLRAESRDVLLWTLGGALYSGAGARQDRGPGQLLGGGSVVTAPSGPAGGPDGPVPDAHAGWTETAIQLALDPGRVRSGLAEPGNRQPIAELLPELRTSGVRAVSPNGVLGDPSGATAARGADLLDLLAADLLAAVAAWRAGAAA